MPDDRTPTIPTDASILLMGMDTEGALRFHADAVRHAPSGVETPGLDYAGLWQNGEEGRVEALGKACDLLDLAATDERMPAPLREEILAETSSMRAATDGVDVGDAFHMANWDDKPHRLMYDAHGLMIRAADAIGGVTGVAA